MCGIGGIAARNLTAAQVASVRAMTAALSHRGPDSSGVEVLGNCALANTRLAILDLSERGHQPMPNGDGSCWITYNGECYNAAELRKLAGRVERCLADGLETYAFFKHEEDPRSPLNAVELLKAVRKSMSA